MNIYLLPVIVAMVIGGLLWKKYASKPKITATWIRRSEPVRPAPIPKGMIQVIDSAGTRFVRKASR